MTALASVQTPADSTLTPGMLLVAVIAFAVLTVAVFYVDRFIKNAEMDKGLAELLDREDAA